MIVGYLYAVKTGNWILVKRAFDQITTSRFNNNHHKYATTRNKMDAAGEVDALRRSSSVLYQSASKSSRFWFGNIRNIVTICPTIQRQSSISNHFVVYLKVFPNLILLECTFEFNLCLILCSIVEKGKKLKTRIICTIGPKSNNIDTLCEMLDAGMCVVRLNTAHGDFDVSNIVY